MKKNIVLTGFMGTGKTVTGKKLASCLSKEFFDTDSIIEEREKDSIVRIFQVKGEEYFRDAETSVIKELSEKDNCIIATGGGAVIRKENVRALRTKGIIVCLTADAEVILSRTSSDNDRPLLLKTGEAVETIKFLLKERERFYSIADFTIDTSSHSPEDTASEIIKLLRLENG